MKFLRWKQLCVQETGSRPMCLDHGKWENKEQNLVIAEDLKDHKNV